MKDMKKSFIFLFLPTLLISCQNTNNEYKPDENKDFQLCRNGDLLSFDFDENTTYEDLGNNLSEDNIDFSMGEGITFIYTSPNCHSCQNFKDTFVSFIKETQLDIYVLNSPTTFSNYMYSYFGEDNIEKDEEHPFLKNTPTWYYASDAGKVKIANWGAEISKNLKKNFFSKASISYIYKFSSIAKLEKGLGNNGDSLIFYLDYDNSSSLSFYKNSLFPKAKKSLKKTFVIDSSRLSASEKEKAKSYFGEYNLIQGNKKESLDNQSSLSLVNSYYN